ncbi:unnamed protein product [Pedinophyceae sp. YPF-701]|nr:unnamed protein product [Pedinophyceae sp. YPF-701]
MKSGTAPGGRRAATPPLYPDRPDSTTPALSDELAMANSASSHPVMSRDDSGVLGNGGSDAAPASMHRVGSVASQGGHSRNNSRAFRSSKGGHARSFSTELLLRGKQAGTLGVPRQSGDVHERVRAHFLGVGATKPIHSVLIANNGNAAVKFTRSLRSWAQSVLGDERAITVVAMASPEDIRIGAEHIRMADQIVEVPGGTNNNNYANVPLIMRIAEQTQVDAVWPGWGHASEVPDLPAGIAELDGDVRFLGPPAGPMAALGDKVGSTILAQAAGVPTIPWSGTGVVVDFEACGGSIPADVYRTACVASLEEALASCNRIGYPVMLKASWGGGGKGIRKVASDEETKSVFKQVQGEVPGSPIFTMKLAPQSRHLEVQLLCDKYGNVVSLYSRDCSVQRRHQKIVEEGPVVAAPAHVLRHMERSARALARTVGYVGAATVEYLYSLDTGEYYFLELNPRLQVEHPVSEMITGVNLPVAQLMIAAGVPLHRIPDIRRLFLADPAGKDAIDFETSPQRPPQGHVVAVRVTCEDAEDGFKPTCGAINELQFRSTPDVWGYFCVKAGGGVHEFSDSQFGHLFARGATRGDAIKSMVYALREIDIRGEIRTIVSYVRDMIQTEDFIANNIHTGWLDARIAAQVKDARVPWHIAVVCGAVQRALARIASVSGDFYSALERGRQVSLPSSLTEFHEEFVIDGVKYTPTITRRGPAYFRVHLGPNSYADAVARRLGDGGYLVQVDGGSHVVQHEGETPTGSRYRINGVGCLLEQDADPSRIIALSPGKLMRLLVEDGAHVDADQPFAEVEVMKMLMTLHAPLAGTIRVRMPEGSVLSAGDLIASLDLDDPSAVQKAQAFAGSFPELGPPTVWEYNICQVFQRALEDARMILAGYDASSDETLQVLEECLEDPYLPLEQFAAALSTVEGRLPGDLVIALRAALDLHAAELDRAAQAADAAAARPLPVALPHFPSHHVESLLLGALQECDLGERRALRGHLEELLSLCEAYRGGVAGYRRGIMAQLLEEFLRVEEMFQPPPGSQSRSVAVHDVVDELRVHFAGNLEAVLQVCLSHRSLENKCRLILRLLSAAVVHESAHFRPVLRRLARLQGAQDVSQRAEQILEHSLMSELRAFVYRHLVASAAASATPTGTRGSLAEVGSPRESLTGAAGLSLSPKAARKSGAGVLGTTPDGRPSPILRKVTLGEGLTAGLPGPRTSSMPPRGATRSAFESDTDADESGWGLTELVSAQAAVEDALASFFDDARLQEVAVATYIRRVYHTFLTSGPEVVSMRGMTTSIWTHTSVASQSTRLEREHIGVMVLMPRLRDLATALENVRDAVTAAGLQRPAAQANPLTVHFVLLSHDDDALALDEKTSALAEPVPKVNGSARGIGESFDRAMYGTDPLLVRRAVAAAVAGASKSLYEVNAGLVGFLAMCARGTPLRCTFVRNGDGQGAYTRDRALSPLSPPIAIALEVEKLRSFPGGVSYRASRNLQIHLYSCAERADARSNPLCRVFARAPVRALPQDALHGSGAHAAAATVMALEDTFRMCLDELASGRFVAGDRTARPDWSHIFLSVLPPLSFSGDARRDDPVVCRNLQAAAAVLVSKNGPALRAAALATLEVRFRMHGKGGSWRVVIQLPTGHESGEEHVDVYREAVDEATGGLVYRSVSPGDPGPLHNRPVLEPYDKLDRMTYKRMAARRFATTYVYDFPAVLSGALREAWARSSSGGAPAGRLLTAKELTLAPGVSSYRGEVPMEEVDRPGGENTVGMVAWMMELKTPEYPSGRNLVVIANDITYQSGAFGPAEDAVFKGAVNHALAHGVPVLYVAANAGARVGLAAEVREKLCVQWVNDDDPTRGFQYLYLSDEDYRALEKDGESSVRAVRVDAPDGGPPRWRIDSVIGREDGLGVECLSGSGAIAGTFSGAWENGVTFTLVSGRTVGIGAYLARLGRRCIQRADQPVILTGHAALNKLLQREVYASNLQLGGPKVMGANGVSNLVVADDFHGCLSFLTWLSFVPAVKGGPLPITSGPNADPISRPVAYRPDSSRGEKPDPRACIAGAPVISALSAEPDADADDWKGGIFDRGSWVEYHAGWAGTVVTGRARLGGVPVGVIAVETTSVERRVPADPGVPESAEVVAQQAGQVWYPDSAEKTAHALQEFKGEGLPVFVLANWRGFSGGQSDLFAGVLQAGSLIVEQLRSYPHPAFVYLPPLGELRGGAWVVIDSQINPDMCEMYAAPEARGGVLEPDGIVEIKYRDHDQRRTMHRLDPVLRRLRAAGGVDAESAMHEREQKLRPVYHQVALAFAEMHDTPARMVAKGVLRGVVPWEGARTFFATRLRRRVAEETLVGKLMDAAPGLAHSVALREVHAAYLSSSAPPAPPSTVRDDGLIIDHRTADGTELDPRVADDAAVLAWAESAGAAAVEKLAAARRGGWLLRELSQLKGGGVSDDLTSVLKDVDGETIRKLREALQRA